MEKQNMAWNMIGSFCYAFASMVLTFLVMGMAGDQEGGVFSFGYSTLGQQLFIVAYFGMRPFQVTDGKGEFSFGDYLSHRILTCLGAVGVGAAWLGWHLAFGEYTAQKALVLFLLVLYKVIDGFADVYESEFQRRGHLHLTGKSNAFRTLLTVSCFLAALAATRRLAFSCMVAVAAQVAGVAFMDIHMIKYLDGVAYKKKKRSSRGLFLGTSLLFLAAFVDFYIFSAAKYAIDANMDNAASGYFNIIFMPTSVINLVAGFVFRPFLTTLTEFWNFGRFQEFRAMMLKILAVVAGLGLLAVAGAWLLGRPVLGILEQLLGPGYGGALTRYYMPFVIVVAGGAFYAVLNLLYYGLVIMRKQKAIFAIYILVGLAALALAGPMVLAYGIGGAAWAYLILMFLLALGFGAAVLAAYKRAGRQRIGG